MIKWFEKIVKDELVENAVMTAFVVEKEEVRDCEDWDKVIELMMLEECEECGVALMKEDKEFTLIGIDAVSLFPSMSGEETGKIVRDKVTESEK